MNIKPLADRVLLKAIEKDNMTNSWIYIPDTASKERPYMYEVISVWEGKDWKVPPVKVWDKILSWQYSGDDIKLNWEEYKILASEYILAVVED